MEFFSLQIFTTAKIPVSQKKILQIKNSRSIDTKMRITPIQFMRSVVDIFIANIYSPGKSSLPVYYDDLSMVPVVEAIGQQIKQHFLKRINFNTGFSHSFLGLFFDIRAPEIIINKTHLYTFICLLYQELFNSFPNVILFINVIFDVN